jgi:hypothetical protein
VLEEYVKFGSYFDKQIVVGFVFAFSDGKANLKSLEFAGGNSPGNPGAYRQGADTGNKLYIHDGTSHYNFQERHKPSLIHGSTGKPVSTVILNLPKVPVFVYSLAQSAG